MQKTLMIICGGLMITNITPASVDVRVLGNCADIRDGTISASIPGILHSDLKKLCNSPSTWNCSSLSTMLCGENYDIIVFNVARTGTSTLQEMVMCLPMNAVLCDKMKNGCPATYGGVMQNLSLDSVAYGNTKLNGAEFYTCCYNCPFGEWQDVNGTNYQIAYAGTCNTAGACSTLTSNPKYRCNSGYYGTGTNCTKCPPSANSGEWITSDAGAITDTQCYIMPEITYGDDTGGYVYTQNCYY